MSRLEQDDLVQNPAKGTIQWKSDRFVIYNKETKENEEILNPFRFVVLEKDYISYTGFSEPLNNGFWSNEVKNNEDLVTIKCGSKVIAEFKKEDWNPKDPKKAKTKDLPELDGCHYTQVLYIATKLENDTKEEIYRLLILKSPLTGGIQRDKDKKELPGQEKDGWIRFVTFLGGGRSGVYKYQFTVADIKQKGNKAIRFNIPVFTAELLEGDSTEYNNMAKEVEEWFKYYSSKGGTEKDSVTTSSEKEEYAEDLPWNN